MIESIYIDRISDKLNRLIETSSHFNFECCFCHEGESAGRKRRAFIIKNKGFSFFCHNCFRSHSFRNFLKEIDPSVYQQFVEENKVDNFYETSKNIFRNKPVEEKPKVIDSSKFTELDEKEFKQFLFPVRESDMAVMYLKGRKVPEEIIDKLLFYFNHKEKKSFNESIVFPFYTNNFEKYYGFQSRSLWTKYFHLELQDESYPKIWNLFNVNPEKTVYIFEGFFDSIVIDNSIALNGADVSQHYIDQIKNPVFVFDNDKTGFEKAMKYSGLGYKCFVYPVGFKYKDFNEYYCKEKDLRRIQIESFIKKNIHDPDSAQMMLLERSFR